uniref:Uncharacterized protein n=2 Tax=Anguilla anguilla TaxID=7936 RepID=A0A0E9Q2Y4_ANGAN
MNSNRPQLGMGWGVFLISGCLEMSAAELLKHEVELVIAESGWCKLRLLSGGEQ